VGWLVEARHRLVRLAWKVRRWEQQRASPQPA
jgi:hypothetical protein